MQAQDIYKRMNSCIRQLEELDQTLAKQENVYKIRRDVRLARRILVGIQPDIRRLVSLNPEE